jgi:hypothetical protein
MRNTEERSGMIISDENPCAGYAECSGNAYMQVHCNALHAASVCHWRTRV